MIIQDDNRFSATIQGTEVRLQHHVIGRLQPKRRQEKTEEVPKRGKVTEFSQKSRVRLLSLMNRIEPARRHECVFITLTFGTAYPSPAEAKRMLRAFTKRLKRIRQNAAVLWRMEFQKRGAPHFHLLVYGVRFIKKQWIKLAWASVVPEEFHGSDGNAPFTRIEKIRTATGAMYYVSKYVAKAEDGFNYVPYSATSNPGQLAIEENCGRMWGIEWADCLPMAPVLVVRLEVENYLSMRALALDAMPNYCDEWGNLGLRWWCTVETAKDVKRFCRYAATEVLRDDRCT